MEMIGRFTAFINEKKLFGEGDRILLAVSGGIDSMVMWHLMETAGFTYGVAHCNFRLRGAESDADEALVRERALALDIPLAIRGFDTLEHARLSGISTEMAARELRYGWFEELRAAGNYDRVATAHHQDDLLETFFLNLLRKTGIRGLTGFREKSGSLVRPLLFASRREIEEHASRNGIVYRRDATNDETSFRRNFIRHEILPRLESLNPAFRTGLAETMANLRSTEAFCQTELNRQIRKISVAGNCYPEIAISSLQKLAHPRLVLFEWMGRYGFNAATAQTVYQNLEREPGRQYFSRSHRLVTARNGLIITPLPGDREELCYIGRETRHTRGAVRLSLSFRDARYFSMIRDARVACLDAGLLDFPLVVRKWQAGEYFRPLGMEGFKKISDFFVDEKLSIPEKEECRILYSGDKVVWIIGRRIDHRFRVTEDTREVLVIRVLPQEGGEEQP